MALSAREDAEAARRAGAAALCVKPVFRSDLRRVLMDAQGQQAQEEPSVLPGQTAGFRGKRLLLVEDNELNREIAVELLGGFGFAVDTAENGAQAVERIVNARPGEFDLVLMDIQMPVMDGYKATRAIRALKNQELSSIPILAMTANAFEEDRKAAIDNGMDGFLSKPIQIEEVVHALKQIFER